MASPLDVDLLRPLARRTATAAVIAAFLLTLGTPLSLYWQTRRAQVGQANSYAHRMAGLVRDVVATQPDLWYYDAPKLANHLALLVAGPDVEQVVIIDALGRRVDVPEERSGRWPDRVRWADAPIYHGHEEVARVWVAVDADRGLAQVFLVLLLALVLGASLSTILYVVPVTAVGRAERRIISLLDKLEAARCELTELNADLEERVEKRSRQLALALDALRESEAKLREVAGRATEATERERARVARELHDGVGQLMTALHLRLQVLRATLDPDEATRKRLDDAENLVDEAIDELRRIAMNLHPAALDRLGLLEALRELCDGVAARAGLVVDFRADELPGELPTAVESACYRVVQEGLTNAVRYAEASALGVRLELRQQALHVVLTDDGRGFDLSAPRQGLGLRGMEDRAMLLGGVFEVSSEATKGTMIRATFPLDAAAAGIDEDEAT